MKSLAEIMDALPADFPYRYLMPRREVAAPRESCDNTMGGEMNCTCCGMATGRYHGGVPLCLDCWERRMKMLPTEPTK